MWLPHQVLPLSSLLGLRSLAGQHCGSVLLSSRSCGCGLLKAWSCPPPSQIIFSPAGTTPPRGTHPFFKTQLMTDGHSVKVWPPYLIVESTPRDNSCSRAPSGRVEARHQLRPHSCLALPPSLPLSGENLLNKSKALNSCLRFLAAPWEPGSGLTDSLSS